MPRISKWTRTVGLALALWGLPAVVVGQDASEESVKTGSAAVDGGWKLEEQPNPSPAGARKDTANAGEGPSPENGEPAVAAEPKDDARSTATQQGSAKPRQGAAQAAGNGEPELDGATYQIRLRDLEQRVDELKEQIRRSHTRLSLLSDTLLAGGGGGAKAEIVFVNDLSAAFKLTEAVFVLDGAVQYRKQDETGTLAAQETIPIFSGSIPAGDHTLQVLLKVRGHGYGVFSYLRGYHFDLRGTHSFTVTDGKVVVVKVMAWERGGATTPLEDRPALRYGTQLRNVGEAPAPSPDSGDDRGAQGSGRLEKSISVGGED